MAVHAQKLSLLSPKQIARAKVFVNLAIQHGCHHGETYMSRGFLHIKLMHYDSALSDMLKAHELSLNNCWTRYAIASLYHHKGEKVRAASWLQYYECNCTNCQNFRALIRKETMAKSKMVL